MKAYELPVGYISADETITLKNRIVIPGLVNTHHHVRPVCCAARAMARRFCSLCDDSTVKDVQNSSVRNPRCIIGYVLILSSFDVSQMYQSLTRCIAQDNTLLEWLLTLYDVWAQMKVRDIADYYFTLQRQTNTSGRSGWQACTSGCWHDVGML
jgi:hypothetical protein